MDKEFKWDEKTVKEFAKQLVASYNSWAAEEIESEIASFKESHRVEYKPVKDWEIVSCYWPYDEKGTIHDYIPEPDPKGGCLKEGCHIHSVRRLSDGEVFTVGDKVDGGSIQKFVLITEENRYDSVCAAFDNSVGQIAVSVSIPLPNVLLKDLVKAPERKVLTTNDGVALKEGEPFWYVNHNVWEVVFLAANEGNIDYAITINKYVPFSKKELADEFLIANKPCLSVNDILSISSHRADPNLKMIFVDGLKDKAKSKIDNTK